jgi:adenine-specific DNA-methyltransferase
LVNSIWISGRTSAAHFTNAHEYIVGYAKNINSLPFFSYSGEDQLISDRTTKKPSEKNPFSVIEFPAGIDFECEDEVFPLRFGDQEPMEVVKGELVCENGKVKHPVSLRAAWAMKDMIVAWLKGKTVIDQKGQKVRRFFFKKNGILQYEKEKGTIHPNSIVKDIATKKGTSELFELLKNAIFPYPKPSELIKHFISSTCSNDSLILDFFSGSATTAHAVMQLNAEDGGKRKFICVQLPEVCAADSEAAKAGYKNICEIGKERIRRAGTKILDEMENREPRERREKEVRAFRAVRGSSSLDIGFRVLKLDSSNLKDVYYSPEEYTKMNFDLTGFIGNIKPDRTSEDLLFQVMLDIGVPLSAKIKKENEVFCVNDNYLIACFEKVNAKIITAIAKRQPHYVVFRDSSFLHDNELVNVGQIFATYSQHTIRRVI